MHLITAQQMRALEHVTIHERGISGLTLMEAGGRAAADAARALVPTPASIGLVLGCGNNAGDGFVAARYLADAGYVCTLYCLGAVESFGASARANWDRLPMHNIIIVGDRSQRDLSPNVISRNECILPFAVGHALIIDGLFGIGIRGVLGEPFAAAIAAINAYPAPVLAIDMPSGLHADTGEVCGVAVRAMCTATFGLPKRGLLMGASAEYVGVLQICDVGFPDDLVASLFGGQVLTPGGQVPVGSVPNNYSPSVIPLNECTLFCNDPTEFSAHVPQRAADTHKHACGHVLVLGGSTAMPGAGLLATRAALRSGAGLATYALPAAAQPRLPLDTPEVMFAPLPDHGRGEFTPDAVDTMRVALEKARALVVGPGMGRSAATLSAIRDLLATDLACPLVLDADALFALGDDVSLIRTRTAPTVLTPHPGEAARLLGTDTTVVQGDRLGAARTLAQRANALVVLKGARTVIAQPDGMVWINPTGNPALATAGSGDVLAGLIAGLLAQGMPPRAAVCAAVYWHGAAADVWAAQYGTAGMLASDVIEQLRHAMRDRSQRDLSQTSSRSIECS